MLLDFIKRKGNKREHYLGLTLKEDEGNAVLLEIDHQRKRVEKKDQKRFSYSDSWERIVEDIDEALFKLESDNKVKVNQVIFFLYSHLVDQTSKKIQEPFLGKIKDIATELEIKPLGYIEFHEALAVFLEDKEEAPLTSIIIEVDKTSVSLLVYKGGELVSSDTIAKTDDLLSDLNSMFTKIKGEIILPSRIIIYNSDKLEKEANKILTHKWDEDLFIQLPRVEVVDESKLMESLIYSFNRQIFGDEGTRGIEKDEKEVMGFLIGKDIRKSEEDAEYVPVAKIAEESSPSQARRVERQEEVAEPKESFIARLKRIIPSFSLGGKIPSPGLNFPSLVLIGVVLIALSVFGAFYFLHKASLTLYFEGEEIKQEMEVKAVLESGEGSVLDIGKVEKMVEATETKETTGEKTIGEKAKGEVTIHNWEPVEKTFAKGTTLETDAGIEFVLDNEVKVASASQVSVGVKETGKTQALVTGAQIGKEGNIGQNEQLKIDNFSKNLYFAVSNEAFTGGSQQTVQTVSKDDIKELSNRLKEKIRQEGEKALGGVDKNTVILPDLTEVEIESENYSAELGEEAGEVSLTSKGKVVFYTYKVSDLKKIILDSTSDLVPENYKLEEKNISYAFSEIEKKEEEITLNIEARGDLLVEVETENLLPKITGKKISDLETIIKQEYDPQSFEVKMKTDLPLLRQIMPLFKKNISVRVESI